MQSTVLYLIFGGCLSNSTSQTDSNRILIFGFTSTSFSYALQISPLSPFLLLNVTISVPTPLSLITSSRSKVRADRLPSPVVTDEIQ